MENSYQESSGDGRSVKGIIKAPGIYLFLKIRTNCKELFCVSALNTPLRGGKQVLSTRDSVRL